MPENHAIVRQELAWRWVWLAVGGAVAAGTVVTVLLWGHRTADHRAAFDAGWRTSAAILALFAVFLGVSRLRLSQREHARQLTADQATRAEAVERQITELSAKASDQLGSDREATRIGGLVALERLAQTHPELRQTAVDQICAYLRQPFHPPTRDDAAGRRELAVRRTAQQILKRHLFWPAEQPQPDTFWTTIHLDLRDAVLVDLDLAGCRVTHADFGDVEFHGNAYLLGMTFGALVCFDHARFSARADFDGATFTAGAVFGKTAFNGITRFDNATFAADTTFMTATFDKVSFDNATFTARACFTRCEFEDMTLFQRVTFTETAEFTETTFTGLATFESARFVGRADFAESTFDGEPRALLFNNARVVDPELDHVWPRAFRIMPNNPQPDGLGQLFLDIAALGPDERVIVGL